ncbi:MAG TPA: hypothetical protein VG433_01655 [Pirellulales bacterium]|nr:hypothetical protein [Pirellulales bacterium]
MTRKTRGIPQRSPNLGRDGGNTHLAHTKNAARTYTIDLAPHDKTPALLFRASGEKKIAASATCRLAATGDRPKNNFSTTPLSLRERQGGVGPGKTEVIFRAIPIESLTFHSTSVNTERMHQPPGAEESRRWHPPGVKPGVHPSDAPESQKVRWQPKKFRSPMNLPPPGRMRAGGLPSLNFVAAAG